MKQKVNRESLVDFCKFHRTVDSTTGVQMAYLKSWAKRSYNDLELRMPNILSRKSGRKCEAHCLDVFDAAKKIKSDIVYLDPPYNQHSYLGNYHMWESLVKWDKTEVYGIACKRVECKERKSIFNSKTKFSQAFRDLLETFNTNKFIISFNNEGYLSKEDMEEILSEIKNSSLSFKTLSIDYDRYVGSKIGIHNLKGEKVGRVSHIKNKEYIYVAVPSSDSFLLDFEAEIDYGRS